MSFDPYETAKNILKQLVPKERYSSWTSSIRSWTYVFYKGRKYQCNICKTYLRKFQEAANGNRICPRCGSIGRSRSMWYFLDEVIQFKVSSILHFSPSASLSEKIKRSYAGQYLTTDYSDEFKADRLLDITNLELDDETFECIICLHVLEHVESDQIAMRELYRVIKKRGFCIVQTPYKKDKTYEDYNIVSEKEREIHFGQKDHVRIYSLNDLKARLEDAGFMTEEMSFATESTAMFLLSDSPFVLARK